MQIYDLHPFSFSLGLLNKINTFP